MRFVDMVFRDVSRADDGEEVLVADVDGWVHETPLSAFILHTRFIPIVLNSEVRKVTERTASMRIGQQH